MSISAMKRLGAVMLRAGVSVALAVSGLIHAELYVHGYRYVPDIGPAFLVQASVFVALAILIAAGGPRWLWWAAGAGALGSLAAFALSRTVGIFGFLEHGWEPSPQALLSAVAEVLTVVLCASSVLAARSGAKRATASSPATAPTPPDATGASNR